MEKARNGQLDFVASSNENFVDEIILTMHKDGILNCLENGIEDKRADNTKIPFDLLLSLSIAAKMKIKTSVSYHSLSQTTVFLLN